MLIPIIAFLVLHQSVQAAVLELNECRENHDCEHECIETLGTYKCVCRTGYQLHSDGKSCEAICGGDIVQDNGLIFSPNYPGDYSPNKACTWKVTVPENHQIVLKFQFFEVEYHEKCMFDYVEIRNGHNSSSPLLGIFCGNISIDDIRSVENKMTIKFVSDHSLEKAGFAASFTKELNECKGNHGCEHECIKIVGTYKCDCRTGYQLHSDEKSCEDFDECTGEHGCEHECINMVGSYKCGCRPEYQLQSDGKKCIEVDTCGGNIIREKGLLHSPRYPEAYGPKTTCTWRIKVPENHRVRLIFNHFEMENHANCSNDYLEIRDGPENLSPLLGRFCGWIYPENIRSFGNKMTVTFKSNDAFQGAGFAAEFIKEFNVCKGNHDCDQVCVLTLESYKCRCNLGYQLLRDGKKCKDKDECAKNNGGCQHICNNTVGSYICSCEEGFILREDGHHCVKDIDECATNNGGCQHICTNTIDSFNCSCRSGFVIDENYHDCNEGNCINEISHPSQFNSPNYPGYPENLDCTFLLASASGHSIILVFQDFELEKSTECEYDHVIVYDGDSEASSSLGKFCDSHIPNSIQASGNRMFLVFKSDQSVNKRGFKATYTTVCGGRLLAQSNVNYFYSHALYGDDVYEADVNCDWTIEGIDDRMVTLQFSAFNLERNENCTFDYVEAFDGKDDSARSFGRFCGDQIPPKLQSSGNSLMIRFISDESNTYTGFAAEYSEVNFSSVM